MNTDNKTKAYIGDEKNIKDYLHFYQGCEMKWGADIVTLIDTDGINCNLIGETLPTKSNTSIKNIIPILRPLSDITEEEWNDIECKSSVLPDAWGYNGLRDNFVKDYRFHWSIVNETLIELRKRGIDVDGLIESGLAIDKTTLNKQS